MCSTSRHRCNRRWSEIFPVSRQFIIAFTQEYQRPDAQKYARRYSGHRAQIFAPVGRLHGAIDPPHAQRRTFLRSVAGSKNRGDITTPCMRISCVPPFRITSPRSSVGILSNKVTGQLVCSLYPAWFARALFSAALYIRQSARQTAQYSPVGGIVNSTTSSCFLLQTTKTGDTVPTSHRVACVFIEIQSTIALCFCTCPAESVKTASLTLLIRMVRQQTFLS